MCVRAASTTVAGDDRPRRTTARSTVNATWSSAPCADAADEYPTSYVTLARLSDQGTVVGPDERVAVAVIDGTMPFTRTKWVLSSWGAGQALPIAGSAPTLTFQNGMISVAPAATRTRASHHPHGGPADARRGGLHPHGLPEESMAQEFRFMAASTA